jgi:hypothetical protein
MYEIARETLTLAYADSIINEIQDQIARHVVTLNGMIVQWAVGMCC